MGKKKTSKAWVNRHLQDPYVKRAQQQGYRARAAFKLTELLDVEKISLRNAVVVDLGSTPGSWSQVARERIKAEGGGGRVIALDLLPMEPIEGVTFLQGDFRDDEMLARLETVLEGQAVDLVISDMAPNLSGVGPADAARIQHVCELAAEFARRHLKPDGTLIVKAFHGSGFSQIVQDLKRSFVRVVERKPQASRDESSETFLVARRLKAPRPESADS